MKDKFYFNNLYINNFKPFPYQHPAKRISFIDLGKKTIQYMVLSGPNGYGKTSIFQAISMALTGRIDIFDFKDKTKKYSEHIIVNEINKESFIALELYNRKTDKFISIVRYNAYAQPCNESEVREGYKDFKLFILNEEFIYDKFIDDLKNKRINPSQENELEQILFGVNMNEWVDSNYIKQEQSSNLLFRSNTERVNFLNYFIEKGFEDKLQPFIEQKKSIQELLKSLKMEISDLNKFVKEQETVSIGEEPKNILVFEKLGEFWDKNTYDDSEDLEGYVHILDELKIFLKHYRAYYLKAKIEKIQSVINKKNEFMSVVLKSLFYEYKDRYIRDYDNKSYIRSLTSKMLLENSIDETKIPANIYELILDVQNRSKQIKELSSKQEYIYNQIKLVREEVIKYGQDARNIFRETCPLCGANYENDKDLYQHIIDYNNSFLQLNDLLSENIKTLVKDRNCILDNIQNQLQSLIQESLLEDKIYYEYKKLNIKTNDIAYLEKLENDIVEIIGCKLKDLVPETNLSEKSIDSLLNILNEKLKQKYSHYINEFKAKYELVYSDLIFKRNRRLIDYIMENYTNDLIEKINVKYSYLNWRIAKKHYNLNIKKSRKLVEKSELYKDLLIKKKKIEKIINAIKDGKNRYMEDLTKHIEIPLYIYSGKLLQTTQNGLGVFCNTGESDGKVTQFKLTTDGNNSAHDIVNKFSSGQRAALNVALILAFRKIQNYKLDVLMIDDPCQSLDDINISSLTEILRNEFKNTQIITSTHSNDIAGYMCYKYSKMDKSYRNFNVQKELYLYQNI